MSTIVTCECGKRLRVPPDKSGKKLKCPGCGKIIITDGPANGSDTGKPAEATLGVSKRPRFLGPLVWGVPLAACVVLVIAIAALPDVRRVVLFQGEAPAGEPLPQANRIVANQEDSKPSVPDQKPPNSTPPNQPDSNQPPKQEPQVLPPAAAKKPGRKLPATLLVGDDPAFFPSLEDAFAVAMSGDTIEIRTNQAQVLTREVAFPGDWWTKGTKIALRAGKGFAPVLRHDFPTGKHAFTFIDTNVSISGIHFAHRDTGATFRVLGGTLSITDCSFTTNHGGVLLYLDSQVAAIKEGEGEALKKNPDACAVSLRCERCYFRGEKTQLFACKPLSAFIEFQDCLVVVGTTYWTSPSFRFEPSPCQTPERCRRKITFRNNTIVGGNTVFSQGVYAERPFDARNSYHLERNVVLSSVMFDHQCYPVTTAFVPGTYYTWRGKNNLYFSPVGEKLLAKTSGDRISNIDQWTAVWAGALKPAEVEMGSVVAMPFLTAVPSHAWQQPPVSFRLRPNVPVAGGAHIGCDVAKIPNPPVTTLEQPRVNLANKGKPLLEKSGVLSEREGFKAYKVTLQAGAKYAILMTSNTGIGFRNPFLRVENAKGSKLAETPPWGAIHLDLHSRDSWTKLDFAPVETGAYTIIATAQEPSTGPFTLVVARQ